MQKSLAEFCRLGGKKRVQPVFRRDMRLPENSSQPASVPKGCAQQAAILFFEKTCLFKKVIRKGTPERSLSLDA
jgi:hypothetical protein